VISPYTGEVVTHRSDCAAAHGPWRSRARGCRIRGDRRRDSGAREAEELVPLEEADAEENTGKVKAVVPESEDDIEIDETIEDDDDDDSTFIADEEEGDEDVTDIIGDVGGDEGDLRSALIYDQGLATVRRPGAPS